MTERRWKRRKQLLDYFKETTGHWKLKEEALDRNLWRTRFGRGCGPVVRHCGMNEWMHEWTNVPVFCLLLSLFILIVAYFVSLVHAWFYVHFVFSSAGTSYVKRQNDCSVKNCKCCGFKHTRLPSWHFCGRCLWTVAFRPELARETPQDTKQTCQPISPSFGLKRFKANGSHMPYRHGYICSWQSVSSLWGTVMKRELKKLYYNA